MPIEYIPDWEVRLARQDAFWKGDVLDRPVVVIEIPRRSGRHPGPSPKRWKSQADRWMDAEYMADQALAAVMNREYLGDALPVAWPNLGPEIFSAFFGCDLIFGETTSWSVPCLESWSAVDQVRFSRESLYWEALESMTTALLDRGKGRFYVGLTDIHPGGDAVAAFRDPMNLALDLLDHVEEVKSLVDRVTRVYLDLFDEFCATLAKEGQAFTNWTGIVSSRKWYVPSNDFSIMISKEMYDDVFLPGIVEECRHMEASMYHLDGPGALRHLDSLLQVAELDAIQWVYGAGQGRATDWLPVYARCQAAGKGVQITAEPDEIDIIMEHLRPEGVWLRVHGLEDESAAQAVIASIKKWR